MKSLLSAALLVLALPQALAAQDYSELARSMARRGWFDLAEELCTKIERDPSTAPDVRAAVPVIRAEIQVAMADRECDAEKAKACIERSVELLNKFIQDQPGQALVLTGDEQSLKKAEVKFLTAISLKQLPRENSRAEDDDRKRIIYWSNIDLCELYRSTNRAKEAKTTVDQVFRDNKDIDKMWFGYQASLQHAPGRHQCRVEAFGTARVELGVGMRRPLLGFVGL